MPGLVEAIVTDNVDAEKLGRVRVKFPTLPEAPESWWARLLTPDGGKHTGGPQRGWVTIPEVGDEVLVTFVHGDFNHAVVLGGIYNGQDLPPYANEDRDNNLRVFQSRSGHRVTFDDTDGDERIEFILHDESIRVIWDAKEKTLSLYGGRKIVVEAKGDVRVQCRDWVAKADQDLSVKAGQNLEVQNGADLTASAGMRLVLKGTQTRIN